MRAAAVEHVVAMSVVMRMSAGFADPVRPLMAITVVGTTVMLEVVIASNVHIASLAVSFLGLSFWSSSIALMPSGVDALPSPSMLELMASDMYESAGCLRGILGNRNLTIGDMALAMDSVSPDAEATCINPDQSISRPVSPITNSTADLQDCTISLETLSRVPFTAAIKIPDPTSSSQTMLITRNPSSDIHVYARASVVMLPAAGHLIESPQFIEG